LRAASSNSMRLPTRPPKSLAHFAGAASGGHGFHSAM
jgi:hypothetical protein